MTLLQSLSVQKAAQFLPVDMQLAWTYSAHWKSNILVIVHIDYDYTKTWSPRKSVLKMENKQNETHTFDTI